MFHSSWDVRRPLDTGKYAQVKHMSSDTGSDAGSVGIARIGLSTGGRKQIAGVVATCRPRA